MRTYQTIIIGGGLAGLSAASLLAKRGVQVALIDKNYQPGGACGIFKRRGVSFDQGSAMLYGFGESGFNAHRFIFNALEEPITMIKHDLLYRVHYDEHVIDFHQEIPRFAEELSKAFPHEREAILKFYDELNLMYQHVMVENPSYTTADEMDPKHALACVKKHPLSYLKFLSFLNTSAKKLLKKYFKDEAIFNFFDKMTSTYCYATVEEAPAVLASVMFVDNHHGGSYYPAGSTLFLPGKLEKVIEEHGGEMLLESEVSRLIIEDHQVLGVKLTDGRELFSEHVIYSGNVWSLYEQLIEKAHSSVKRRMWARAQKPTHPSVVFYSVVKGEVIPEGTLPIEMLVGDPEVLNEDEVTAYMFSLADRTLCGEDEEIVIAIGPSLRDWDVEQRRYQEMKQEEMERLTEVLSRRFPGFREGLLYRELATPKTLERYSGKYRGSVAGPKQMLGQHMFKRLHTRTEFKNLFCCGESTVMGTGTPTVSVSGVAAANAVLKDMGLEPYVYDESLKNRVELIKGPFTREMLFSDVPAKEREIRLEAHRCQFCEHPLCERETSSDVRGIMRRVAVSNDVGAKKAFERRPDCSDHLQKAEAACLLNHWGERPVAIREVLSFLGGTFE